MNIFLPLEERPEFVACAVGTRLHQDDVDLGIVDDGSEARGALNKAIGRMGNEMMKWTSVPDFYLSEHIGNEGYSASLEEYLQRLDDQILDFVSVSEILTAFPIIGSKSLFNRFRKQVHSRYYYSRRPTQEHEGYLRGILAELESFLRWPRVPERMNPKDDMLRLVIGVNCAYRTIYRITEPDTWRSLREVASVAREHRGLFEVLERSYTFVETFRHLYQQFVAQEEEIDLTDAGQCDGLQHVALAMGYENLGVIWAWEHLAVDYLEHVKAGHEIVKALTPDIARHIRTHTVFRSWFDVKKVQEDGRDKMNLPVEFLHQVTYFEGIKYWDDILDALGAPDGVLLRRLVNDLKILNPTRRKDVLENYARWGHHTFHSLLRLLTILGENEAELETQEIFDTLNEAFLSSIEGTPDEIRRLSTLFVHYPALVHQYLTMLGDDQYARFIDKIAGEVWDAEVAVWRNQLLMLCDVHSKASRYFRRTIESVAKRHPEYLKHFSDPDKLGQIAKGILAEVMRLPSPEDKKRSLGLYYDVEFLRIGLSTLQGAPVPLVDAEFTEFSDLFLELLFNICKTEVDRERGRRILTHDHLALFVAGGHARGRALQDDYDLILLLNSDSESMYEYSNRIATRLNREITRRGIMPQYRLADRFGGYVTRFSELRRFLSGASPDDAYVEMAQLVGARLIVGSSRLEDAFYEKIVEKCVYKQKDKFVRLVAGEIASRHEYELQATGSGTCDIKECRGGLRDLEMAMLIWKVVYEIREPIGGQFWEVLAERNPDRSEEFENLMKSYQFLNRLRDLYRLSVAPVNVLDENEFHRPARIMGYEERDGKSPAERLAGYYVKHREQVARRLSALVKEVAAT